LCIDVGRYDRDRSQWNDALELRGIAKPAGAPFEGPGPHLFACIIVAATHARAACGVVSFARWTSKKKDTLDETAGDSLVFVRSGDTPARPHAQNRASCGVSDGVSSIRRSIPASREALMPEL